MTGAVETKVQASAAAAAVSGIVLFILGRYAFRGAVPDVVASWVYAAVPGILAFTAGYLARHTPRPATPPVPMPPAAAVTQPPAVAGDPGAAP